MGILREFNLLISKDHLLFDFDIHCLYHYISFHMYVILVYFGIFVIYTFWV
jgi:hypothetical protein